MPGRVMVSPAPGMSTHRTTPHSRMSTPHSRMSTPSNMLDYVSPASINRRVAVVTGSPRVTPAHDNNDAAERNAQRMTKVMEMQRMHLTSPSTPTDRRRSTPLSGLSVNQLTDHYTSCIKLSTENKINSKNAFDLHLIDYMTAQLKKKELTNFQVASSTLDASAKIYAGRVDAIHTETYKMLGGLGRGTDNKGKDKENIDADEFDENGHAAKKLKKRKNKRTTQVEHNLKNINRKKVDLEFEVDPLFSKMSASYDDGTTSGLLLNHLRCLDDASELAIVASVVLPTDASNGPRNECQKAVDLKEFKELYTRINANAIQICPRFSNFEFTNWNKDGEDEFSVMMKQMAASDQAFDIDAETEPIPESRSNMATNILGMPCVADIPYDDVCDHDDVGTETGDSFQGEEDGGMVFGDGKEAHLVNNVINDIKHSTVGTLLQVLATVPGEYSYFNDNLLKTWAGPSHWRLQPQSKDPSFAQKTKSKLREKKQPYRNEYDTERDFEALFKETRAATTLTKRTLEKYLKSQTTLPKDLHYEADKIFRLFGKPKVMVKRTDSNLIDVDNGIETYDYNNEHDKENFCPQEGAMEEAADDDGDEGNFNFTLGSNESQNEEMTFQGSFLGESVMNGTLLTEDNMVSQPNRVATIDINYAKTAKKIDVKRLKASIWRLLTVPKERDLENLEESAQKEPPTVNGNHSFKEMLEVLPRNMSKHMANNLSVPIAFVCLLHLANEKTLRILSDDSLADLLISQDT